VGNSSDELALASAEVVRTVDEDTHLPATNLSSIELDECARAFERDGRTPVLNEYSR
jgi:hypothetical protein